MDIKPVGTIVWHNIDKGFGFLRIDGCQSDTFFHIKNCIDRELEKGDRVSFEFLETQRGIQAINVKKL